MKIPLLTGNIIFLLFSQMHNKKDFEWKFQKICILYVAIFVQWAIPEKVRTCCLQFPLSWRWRLQVPPKCRYLSTRVNRITSLKTTIVMFTNVTISNLTQFKVLTMVYTIIFKINKCSNCVHDIIFKNVRVCLYSNSSPTERIVFNGYKSASSHRLSMGVPKRNKTRTQN